MKSYEKWGVLGDAGQHEALASLLTLRKVGGGLRWVIPSIEANEISVPLY